MRLTYDATTDTAYLALRPLGAAEPLGPTLLVEPDPSLAAVVAVDVSLVDGRVVGLEFQVASACLPAELLTRAERVDGCHLEQRYAERVARRLSGALAGGDGPRPGTGRPRPH
jgi:uncharacterized protein YuzE